MPEVPFRLRFFVLGAQKCATSWLYYCLRDHKDVVLPTSKIEHAYIGGATFRERGHDWYFRRFPDAAGGGAYGEVAVDYLVDSTVPSVLGSYADDPRFVILIRHPVERLVSAYYWSVRRRQLPHLPIDRAIAPLLDEVPGFPRRFENRHFDELIRRGFYGEQLAAYLCAFEPERFLAIEYSEIEKNAAAVVRRVYAHIGVDPTPTPPSLRVRPKRNSYSRAVVSLERFSERRNFRRIVDRANRVLSRINPRGPGLSLAARHRLIELFEPHILRTEQVLSLLPPGNRPNGDLIRSWRLRRQSVPTSY